MTTQFYDEGGYISAGTTTIINTTGSEVFVFTGSQWKALANHTVSESFSWTTDVEIDSEFERQWLQANPKMPTRAEATIHLKQMTPAATRLVFGLSRREERIMRGVERKQPLHNGGKP